jgi:flagellar biosynthesis/type III secretory pathway protein FliH
MEITRSLHPCTTLVADPLSMHRHITASRQAQCLVGLPPKAGAKPDFVGPCDTLRAAASAAQPETAMATRKSKNPELAAAANDLTAAAHHIRQAINRKLDEIGAAASARLDKAMQAAQAKRARAERQFDALLSKAQKRLTKASNQAKKSLHGAVRQAEKRLQATNRAAQSKLADLAPAGTGRAAAKKVAAKTVATRKASVKKAVGKRASPRRVAAK